VNKVIELSEAVDLLSSGMTLALGGMTLYRRPIAFVKGLLEKHHKTRNPSELTLLAFTMGLESDLLVGTGIANRTRTCYFGLEVFGLAPMFTYRANKGEIEIVEETEASLAFGIRAKTAGVGFMPGRGWLGTDLPALRPDVKSVIDPYSGEELMAFPAIEVDVAVIHALIADYDGNAQIGDNKGIDIELSVIAKKTIVTAEEIVPKLDRADVVAPYIHAVVHAPQGAYPTSCHPLYPLDGNWLLDYIDQVSDEASLQSFLDRWL